MRLLHVISGLSTGGAEVLLVRTIEGLQQRGIRCYVASVAGHGPMAAQLAEMNVPVIDLQGRSVWQLGRAVRNLRRAIGSIRPDVIHSWMYHANAVTHLSRLGTRTPAVVTSVHHSLDNESDAPLSRRLARCIDARFSQRSAAVIYPASRGMQQHIEYGYCESNAQFLPSGFDVRKFAPNAELRAAQRRQLGIGPEEFVIGCVARFDPIKDHATLLRAAAAYSRHSSTVRFLLVGRGVSAQNSRFSSMLHELGGTARYLLLGERRDLPALYACMDVACLSSKSEGFPLTLGEAMASGVSCVATNVGDCGLLLGDAGLLVPPQDHEALADSWRKLESMGAEGRRELGARARSRIIAEFSLEAYMNKLTDCYRAAVNSVNRLAEQ
jgi:glycosyltransferase involved in cell wall biosynthesis